MSNVTRILDCFFKLPQIRTSKCRRVVRQHTEDVVESITRYMRFVGNLHLFPAVKEFWEYVKNWQSHRDEFGVLLFWDNVYSVTAGRQYNGLGGVCVPWVLWTGTPISIMICSRPLSVVSGQIAALETTCIVIYASLGELTLRPQRTCKPDCMVTSS